MRSRRESQKGFALLLVFVMAAAVLLTLYTEMPRAVFESERNREGLLVERGEQYQMAIRRYFKKFQKYPQTLDELDKTNGIRFLRRRYIDPFTGKSEWKVIKMDAAGNLIDSVQSKKKGPLDKDDDKNKSTGAVVALAGLGDMAPQGGRGDGEQQNIALQRRGSDRGVGGELAMQNYQQQGQPVNQNGGQPAPPPGVMIQQGMTREQIQANLPEWARQTNPAPVQNQGYQPPSAQQLLPGNDLGNPSSQATLPPTPNFPPGFQLPGMVPQQPGVVNQPQMPVNQIPQQRQFPGMPSFPGQVPSGQGQNGQQNQQSTGAVTALPGLGQAYPPPGQNNANQNVRPGGVGFNPGQQLPGVPTANGVANSQTGGVGGIGGSNAAVNGIMNTLMNPSGRLPVGMGGTPGMVAGGIVGVASKYKAEGIKVIEERTKINEWEFIYDYRKDKKGQQGAAGMAGGSNPLGGAPPSGSMPTGTATGSKK